MSDIPEGQYYTKEHEWIRVEGDEVVIGITDHAQDALTDIVYIELPDAGEMCEEMGEFAIVESVKSASPIFAPLAGEITAVNEALDDAPELIQKYNVQGFPSIIAINDGKKIKEHDGERSVDDLQRFANSV